MGFSRKFKKGDKVRVIKPNDPRYKQIGKIIDYYSSYSGKGIYGVNFEKDFSNYYSNSLEKVEDSSNTNIESNKLSIFDLKPGMKVRIRPDLKEGQSTQVYVTYSMSDLSGTVYTIKAINSNNNIILKDLNYVWDIDCFSEIVEESEEVKVSEKIKFPLKEGQIVTLLDGKKYQVINNKNLGRCSLCSLGTKGCNNCSICYINGKVGCAKILPALHYFKLVEDNKKENKSSNSVENSSAKEIGIITKVNFTLTDFKPEKLEHSKFTIL